MVRYHQIVDKILAKFMTQKNQKRISVLDIFIELFDKFSNKAYSKLQEDQDFREEAQLYHYTSLQSLQKIIETQSLRATSIYMLNDPNELVYGYKQISKWFLGDINRKISTHPRYKSIYGFPAFVFSLTELNDDMHFWEKYGDRHKGVRIGFTPENLVQYWRSLNNVQVILTPVIYQNYDHKFIGTYSDEFIYFKNNFIQKINNFMSENELDETEASQLAYCSALIASLIKRKEWSLEREWRILCIPRGHVHEAIIGVLSDGAANAKLENKSKETLTLLTNKGHDGLALKHVLKIGHLADDIEFVRYAIQLLFKKSTGCNFFNDNITRSSIITR